MYLTSLRGRSDVVEAVCGVTYTLLIIDPSIIFPTSYRGGMWGSATAHLHCTYGNSREIKTGQNW